MYFTPFEAHVTPAEVARRWQPKGGVSWLDGGLTHGEEGRWSFVAGEPVEERRVPCGTLAPLSLFAEMEPECSRGELPLRGPLSPEQVPRWIGYIAYDAHFDGPLRSRHAPPQPAVLLRRYDSLYAYDHEEEQGWAIADTPDAAESLARWLQDGQSPPARKTLITGPAEVPPRAEHIAAIERALEHMRDGDIYQLNLARRWRARCEGTPLELFLRMRALSPVPLGAYLDAGDHSVLSCSMERFLRWQRSDGALWSSPIKGTCPSAQERHTLAQDPKEQTEHAMVIDLIRNDLGRVAKPGSVSIDPLMGTWPFAGLHHLVSTVHAQAVEDLTLDTLLQATFPPGSVTGTPKQRAMEIIDALEPQARGVYCGAVGFVDRTGGCSWAVAIRTATVTDGMAEYYAGGGLVVRSHPGRETDETELKARVFLDSLSESGPAEPEGTP